MWKYEKPEIKIMEFTPDEIMTDNITASTNEEEWWIPEDADGEI